MVITFLVVWISRRLIKTTQTQRVPSRTGGPRGRALAAGYPLSERPVSSGSRSSQSTEGASSRIQAYRQRARAHRQSDDYIRERIVVYPVDPQEHRQRMRREVSEPEPEIEGSQEDAGSESRIPAWEERYLENGESYTYSEFQRFFGMDALRQWNLAPIREQENPDEDVNVVSDEDAADEEEETCYEEEMPSA